MSQFSSPRLVRVRAGVGSNAGDADAGAPVVYHLVAMATRVARDRSSDGVPAQRVTVPGRRRRHEDLPDEVRRIRSCQSTTTRLR